MKKNNNELPVVSIRLVSEPPYISDKPILKAQDAVYILGKKGEYLSLREKNYIIDDTWRRISVKELDNNFKKKKMERTR